MEKELAGEHESAHAERCVCREFANHIASVFGIKSDAARGHLLNARIEMLKAVRSIIDDRIDHLSRAESRGTKVAVE